MIPRLNAKDALVLSKRDIKRGELVDVITDACYAIIYNCSACGSTNICHDVEGIDKSVFLVTAASKVAARRLRRAGYSVTIIAGSCFSIEWEGRK